MIFGLPHLVIPRLLPAGAVYTPFASFGAGALIYDESVLYAPQAHYAARTLRPPYDAGSYEHRGRPAVVPTIPYEEGRNGFVVAPADPGALADRIEWCPHHPKIQSYQRHVSGRSVRLGRALAGGSLTLTACSRSCAGSAGAASGEWVIVPNGVPAETYAFRPAVEADAPLVFLGRVERIKGAHAAVEVARKTGRRLVIAGNPAVEGREREYFEREIAPHCDGRDVSCVGPVTDAEKNDLLGQAAALLFPVEWEEPFGIVMVEALACGTPVIALGRGAVPEVVEDGQTGFICGSVADMVEAVRLIPTLARARCRASYETRFSDDVVVGQYDRLYRDAVARAAASRR